MTIYILANFPVMTSLHVLRAGVLPGLASGCPSKDVCAVNRLGRRQRALSAAKAGLSTVQRHKGNVFLWAKVRQAYCSLKRIWVLFHYAIDYLCRQHLPSSWHLAGFRIQRNGADTDTLATAVSVGSEVLCFWPGSFMSPSSIHKSVRHTRWLVVR